MNSIVEPKFFARSNADVGNALEDIDITPGPAADNAEIIVGRGYTNLGLTVHNTGAAALTDFSLMVKWHENDSFVNFITDTDWSDPVNDILWFKSADMNTLAGTTEAKASIRFGASPYSIKFQAKCGTSTALAVRGGFGR